MTPLIIPIFLPHLGCRQHCLFCNQRATVQDVPSPKWVRAFIETSLSHVPPHSREREKQVAFYGGSFTAMGKDDQVSYLKEVQPFLLSGRIHSIRLSTRPDALYEETLATLKTYGVKTIEMGVQSMFDEVLLLSKRGHCAEDSVSAMLRLKLWGFEVGVHLMIGLPGDTFKRFSQSLDQIIGLKPDFVRIHPALVVKGSSLETLWRSGVYSPLTLEQSMEWLKQGILKLERHSIPVARVGLQPTPALEADLLAGPFHPALHHLVESALFYDMAKYLLMKHPEGSQPVLVCHPKDSSSLRGQRNENILKLREAFGLQPIRIETNEEVEKGTLILKTSSEIVSMHRREIPVETSSQTDST